MCLLIGNNLGSVGFGRCMYSGSVTLYLALLNDNIQPAGNLQSNLTRLHDLVPLLILY
jgi:hypothetical protein